MKKYMRLLVALALGCCAINLSAQDSTPPTIQAVSPPAGATVGSLLQVTVSFSEPIKNVAASDLLANGIPAISLTGSGATYTFVLEEEPTLGLVEMSWDPSHDIRDLSPAANRFNENGSTATWQYTLFDGTPPTVALLEPAPGVSLRSLTQVEVSFSEAVVGVDPGDLLVNAVPATGLQLLGVGRYRFTFSQPANGTVQIQWAGNHQIRDLAAVPNSFSGSGWTYQLDPNLGVPAIRINEFVGGNVSGLLDENGEAQDWIEIWNYGSVDVNLAGYSLTDDAEDPGRWTFPATNLAPGQFLVVFASGKDRKSPATPALRLHTNFRLGTESEYLGLYNAESPRVVISDFAPEYPPQRNNTSYGPDTGGQLKYFATPTPGGPNGESQITAALVPPHFNVERGSFDRPIQLVLTHPIYGVSIRYTTDGSEPAANNGQVYFAPLTISNSTPVRAAAFKSGFLPSTTVTHTYLFPGQTIRQPNNPSGYPTGATVMGGYPADYEMDSEIVNNPNYGPAMIAALRALPSVSMVTSIDNMFGPTNGIYTHISEDQAQFRGEAWERACSVEFMPNDGSEGFQINCGIRMQGNASRNPQKTPKHPFRLLFKNDYGPGRLEAKVFPDSPVQSFNTLVMRADFNNSWLHWSNAQRDRGTRIRDAWAKDTWRAMGQPGSHSRYFHLYINGIYWGIYDFGERIDATMAANYLGGEPEEYDAVASKPVKAVDGDLVAFNAMSTAVKSRPQATLSNYQAVLGLLDIDNFADYMILNFYGANQDWGNDSNWNAIRRRNPSGKFQFVSWDGEQLIVGVNDNRVANADVPAGLHTSLLNSPEYRLAFADRAHKHLYNGGALTTNATIARWNTRANELSTAIIAESARWGDYRRDVHQYQTPPYILYTRDTGTTNWQAEINRLLTAYFPQRSDIFLNQLRAAGLYPNVEAPSFNQHGGVVAGGFNLTMSAASPIYYTLDGSDPRVFGTGAISPVASLYAGAIVLNSSTTVKARALSGTNWSALNAASFSIQILNSPLRITEIMYNPIGGDAYEYLELKNIGSSPLDVSGQTIDAIDFAFPPNTILEPGQVIVLGSATSPGNWAARYPGVVVFGRFTGKLDNAGEKLAIANGAGATLWSVDYDDENGWPREADGQGYSLEIIDPLGDPDNPANWRISAGSNGTPGTVTPPPGLGAITINEVMAENLSAVQNGGTYPDWVELRNGSGGTVNLAGWSLSDDTDPRKFVFPAGTSIGGGGYLVVWCDTNSAAPGLHTRFALARNGDSVFLYDVNTNRVDAVGFGLQLPNQAIGRVGGAWTLTQPTPGTANSPAALDPSSNLSINEWLANSVPGGDDWVELYNRGANPVHLGGVYVAVGSAIHSVPPLSFIGSQGYVQLLADENPGAKHLDYKLPAAGGSIVLYSEGGFELERVNYGVQLQGVSQGRLPDGTSTIVNFPTSPSPEAANYLPTYSGPLLNEVLAINRSAATNATGQTADFVELRNASAAPFDMSGLRLSTDPANAAEWSFPPSTVIPANGYLVVWFDEDEPATTTAGTYLNTGHSLDGESGEVWLFSAAGLPVDSVVFGFQIPDSPIGRVGDGSWNLLATPTPGAANAAAATVGSAAGLRLNEWLAGSPSGDDWFELFNTGPQAVSLEGLLVNDNPSYGQPPFILSPLSFIGANGFVRLKADANPSNGRNHVSFSLNEEGDSIWLSSATLGLIDTVSFGRQPAGVTEGRLPDGTSRVVSFPVSPTPGESNYEPWRDVVINEVIPRAVTAAENAIELRNTTGSPVSLNGWYLSDSPAEFKKYRISDGTTIPANGIVLIAQSQFAGGTATVPFTLDGNRSGEVWLSETAGGVLTGRRVRASSGVADPGMTFGRLATTLTVEFPPTQQGTPGGANTPPRVGPVVINEVMYHPPEFGGIDSSAEEFVELYNTAATPVSLFASGGAVRTWRVRGEIDYAFPNGVTMAPRSHLVLVNFDPVANAAALNAFRSRYGIPAGVPVYGPFLGRLNNAGGEIELLKPQIAATGPAIPWVSVDRVDYGDAYPWPPEADGTGPSLQRRHPFNYGNEPTNWKAEGATAGRPNVPGSSYTDSDSDGLPDAWEVSNGLNPSNAADAGQDADGDGRTNYEEYFDGTNPKAPTSHLDGPSITQAPQSLAVQAGTSASFSVAATGSGPLAYQWRRNGEIIPGATGSTLLIGTAIPADAGDYAVSIWNGVGYTVSSPATLVVRIPPVVLLHPQSQIISSNGSATFTVGGVGTGSLRYRWQFNGADIADATNASLIITGATLSNEGDYQAFVTDDFGTAVSEVARLTVRIAPRILVAPTGSTNVVGASVTFNVVASGSVPMSFQWRRGSLPLTNQILMTTNASFTLVNLQTNDSGSYRVVITNLGTVAVPANALFSVLVVAPPTVLGHPTNVTASIGGSAAFAVTAGGSGPFRYQWYFQEGAIPNATNASHSIPSVQAADQGAYRVVVANLAGSTSSGIGTLTVAGTPPTIISQPRTQGAVLGGTATFSVAAIGDGFLEYQWRMGTTDLPGQNNPVLLLSNVQASDAGAYSVLVANAFGLTESQVATLSISGPPRLSDLTRSSGGEVRMNISGPVNRTYTIEYSGDLNAWNVLTSLTYTNGLVPVTDSTAAGQTNRFYRARMQ